MDEKEKDHLVDDVLEKVADLYHLTLVAYEHCDKHSPLACNYLSQSARAASDMLTYMANCTFRPFWSTVSVPDKCSAAKLFLELCLKRLEDYANDNAALNACQQRIEAALAACVDLQEMVKKVCDKEKT